MVTSKKTALLGLMLCSFGIAHAIGKEEKTRTTVVGRSLRIYNRLTVPLTVLLIQDDGQRDFVYLQAKETKDYKWHRGAFNVKQLRITTDQTKRWGDSGWLTVDIPVADQGAIKNNRLVCKGNAKKPTCTFRTGVFGEKEIAD